MRGDVACEVTAVVLVDARGLVEVVRVEDDVEEEVLDVVWRADVLVLLDMAVEVDVIVEVLVVVLVDVRIDVLVDVFVNVHAFVTVLARVGQTSVLCNTRTTKM